MRDIRIAIRQLRKAPGFTFMAAAVLALGVGANTAMFSVIDAVLLKPLPYPDAGRLAWVGEILKRNTADQVTLTPDFLEWRRRNHVFTGMAAFTDFRRTLIGMGEPVPLITLKASAALLTVLQVQPLLGRGFLPGEDLKGSDRVAILSHGLWQRSFGGDRTVIGRAITLDDGTYTVVGVMTSGFHFPTGDDIGLMTPLGKNEEAELQREANNITAIRTVIARLRPGVTLQQARAEMEVIEAQLPRSSFFDGMTLSVIVTSLHERFTGNLRGSLLTLLGAVGFLLLLACANVANLLLSRTISRRQETAIRSALGATRWHIARQHLAETLVLAALGCGGGLLLAYWTRGALVGLLPAGIPGLAGLPLDFRVFGFAVAMACGSALLFGMGPALARSGTLAGSHWTTTGKRQLGWLRLMAAGQMAIAIVLLAGGSLMLRSFWNLRYRDLGFRSDHLLSAHLNLNRARYGDSVKQAAFLDKLVESIGSLPGVETAALGSVPPGEGHATNGFAIEGQAPLPPAQRPVARQFPVSPEYFRILGIAVVAGRGLLETDTAATERVAVVGETFARRNFADGNVIGRKIRTGRNAPWHTIVGTVADIKTAGLGTAPEPVVYFPYRQTPFDLNGVGILMRTAVDPASIGRALRKRVAQLDPEQAVIEMATMDERLNGSVSRPRLTAVLLGCFAAMGLVLATVGLYGVMSFLVKSRLREMGIRLAVGARPDDLVRLVLGQSLRLILAGVAVGLAAAVWLTRFVQNLLYGVSASDPLTFAAAIGFLVMVGLAAAWVPARQAAGVDPMTTLRGE